MPIRGSQLGLGFPSPPLAPHPTWRPLLFSEVPWSLSSTKDHCQQLQPVYWLLCWVGAWGASWEIEIRAVRWQVRGQKTGRKREMAARKGKGMGKELNNRDREKQRRKGEAPTTKGETSH